MPNKNYERYQELMVKIKDIESAAGLMNWDQEVNLPSKAGDIRGQQLSTIAGIAHEHSTSKELEEVLNALHEDQSLDADQRANVERSLEDLEKAKKYPNEFVVKLSKTTSETFHAWLKALEENDYNVYQPVLDKMVQLKKEEAELLGYEDHPYDALMDTYEKGAKTQPTTETFEDVKKELIPFLEEIQSKPKPDDSFMFQHFDKHEQWQFGMDLLKQIGYDFEAGRQDIAPHPFTISFGCNDVRITTRIDEKNFNEMVWSTIHEGGHALYEQGLREDQYGMPLGEAVSLGIHESQSRLWENNVVRSRAFWEANYPALQKKFPDQLGNVSLDAFYKGMNIVQPSLIRTDADEITYHFHILIRFEIEKGLMEGTYSTDELRDVWNQKYKDYLGIDIPEDRKGILQDIHWSHGGIGYFPTYSFGSFYAAQFYHQATKDIPTLEDDIANGDPSGLLNWLRTNIHQHGKRYRAKDLCEKVTGEPLNFQYFMDYARKKYGDIYDL